MLEWLMHDYLVIETYGVIFFSLEQLVLIISAQDSFLLVWEHELGCYAPDSSFLPFYVIFWV